MNLASLFATLGLKVEAAQFAAGSAALSKLRADAEMAMAKVASDTDHFNGIVREMTVAARGNVEEAAMSWDGWNGKVKKSIDWTKVWSTGIKIAVGAVIAGFAIYRGARGVMGMIKATAAQGAAADELSQKLGISAEAVQELGYAATLSGSSSDGLASAMGKLAKNADLAKNGGKDAAKAFRSVGVNLDDVISGRQSLDGTLGQIAEHFAKMPDGAKKSALAMKLFGKSGAELIPLLNEGAAGVGRLREQAREMGYVIDNDTTKALEGFGDETDKVAMQLEGMRNDAIKAILPSLLEMVKGMQAWIKANRATIVNGMTSAMRGMIAVIKGGGAVIKWFAKHSTIAKISVLALGAAFVAMGIQAAAAWLAALWPIALVVAAIAAFIYFFEDIVAIIFTLIMKQAEALDWLLGKFKALGRGVKSIFSSIGSFFGRIASGIRSAFESVINWAIGKINWAIDKMNWVLRQFNRFSPFDVGTIDTLDTVGKHGSKKQNLSGALGQFTRPFVPLTPSISMGNTTIHVSSPNADPAQVAVAVDAKINAAWDRKMRAAAAGLGLA